MAGVDLELERLLEALEGAQRRMDVRTPLIEEALIELRTANTVVLDGYLGFGRTLRLSEDARDALEASGKAEIEELRIARDEAKDAVIQRRVALAES